MKKQMIKLSVIAAVLSGMTFSAMAVPVDNVALDLRADIVSSSCSVTLGSGNSVMAWPGLITANFDPATTNTVINKPKEVTVNFGACQGADSLGGDVQMTAVQGGIVGSDLVNAGLWGDSDTTGAGFQITATPTGGPDKDTAKVLKPNDNSVTIAATTIGQQAGDVTIDPVNISVDVASTKLADDMSAGTVKAIVTLAAVYE